MSNELKIIDTYEKVSENLPFDFNPALVAVAHKTVAKGTSFIELMYFLGVCNSVGLNPLNKEIWCYKDYKGNVVIFTGRDGLLSKAQNNPNFNGIRSQAVYENDTFVFDPGSAEIKHIPNILDRGKLVAAWCKVFRKNGEPTVELAFFKDYNKNQSAWKTHPAAMICKVAESNALKKAFGFSGVQLEHEWDVKDGIAIPNNTDKKRSTPDAINEQKELDRIKGLLDKCCDIDEVEMLESDLKEGNGLTESIQEMLNERKEKLSVV